MRVFFKMRVSPSAFKTHIPHLISYLLLFVYICKNEKEKKKMLVDGLEPPVLASQV